MAGMRRSRTAPTVLGTAGTLPAGGSLSAGMDQLPLELPQFGSIPPLPTPLSESASLANGLLPPTTSFGATGALAAAAAFSAADAAAAAMAGSTPTAASAGATPSAFAAAAFGAPFGAAPMPPPPPMPLPVPSGLLSTAGTPSAAAAEAASAAADEALGSAGKRAVDPELDARFCQAVRLFGRDLKVRCTVLRTLPLPGLPPLHPPWELARGVCRRMRSPQPPDDACAQPCGPSVLLITLLSSPRLMLQKVRSAASAAAGRLVLQPPPPQAISAYLGNKTVAATRLYWSRHRERLCLDAIMAERAAAGLGAEEPMPGAAAAAAALPNLQGWAPLLDQLQQQQQQQAGQGQGPAGEAAAVPSAAALFAAAEAQHQPLAAPGGLPAVDQGPPRADPAEAGSLAATPAATPRAVLSDAEVAADVARCAVAAAIAAHDGPPAAPAAAPTALPAAATATLPAAAATAANSAAAAPAAPPAPPAVPAVPAVPSAAGGEAVSAAFSSAAASLLPLEELQKLQGLLQPGGFSFEAPPRVLHLSRLGLHTSWMLGTAAALPMLHLDAPALHFASIALLSVRLTTCPRCRRLAL